MKRPTLQRRLTSLLFRWCLIFLALAAAVNWLSSARYESAALEERLILARALSRHLDALVGDLFTELRRIAADPDVTTPRAVDALRACRFRHAFRDAVYVLDGDGTLVVADPPGVQGVGGGDLRRRESVTSLRRKTDGTPFVAAIQPFTTAGAPYFLVAEMHLGRSAVSELLRDLAADTDLHLFIVDQGGAILAAPRAAPLSRQVPMTAELVEHLREHRPWTHPDTTCWCGEGEGGFATVVAPLETVPWGVVFQEPRRRAFTAVFAARQTFLATLVLLAALGLFLSLVLSRVVISPIRELSDQAERLRRGELERPIAVEGDHEIQVLAHSMDQARRQLTASLGELRQLNETLEEQVAARTAESRRLVRRLLGAGEEERKRIARELHDEISQLLTVVQLSLEALPDDAAGVSKARHLLTKTQKELHRVIYDLRPSLLDDLGLAAAIRWYAENVLEPRGLAVHLEIEEDLRLASEIEIATFRIFQEIVTNILRHARADNVSIELYAAGRRLVLAVEDDGTGFSREAATAGAGLVGMRERAEIVGGHLHLDSAPGTGTQVVMEIPIVTAIPKTTRRAA